MNFLVAPVFESVQSKKEREMKKRILIIILMVVLAFLWIWYQYNSVLLSNGINDCFPTICELAYIAILYITVIYCLYGEFKVTQNALFLEAAIYVLFIFCSLAFYR